MPAEYWDSLGKFANVLQVLSVIFPLYAFARLLTRSRQLEARLKALATRQTDRPAAVAVGLGDGIEKGVRKFLGDQGLTTIEVFQCTHPGMIQRTEFPAILQELRELKRQLNDRGVTELHLFYKGPVTFAVAMGALFHNWVPLKVYAFEGGKYVLQFYLDKEAVVAP